MVQPNPDRYVIGCLLAALATASCLVAASLTPAGHSRPLGIAAAIALTLAVTLGVRALIAAGFQRSRDGDR